MGKQAPPQFTATGELYDIVPKASQSVAISSLMLENEGQEGGAQGQQAGGAPAQQTGGQSQGQQAGQASQGQAGAKPEGWVSFEDSTGQKPTPEASRAVTPPAAAAPAPGNDTLQLLLKEREGEIPSGYSLRMCL